MNQTESDEADAYARSVRKLEVLADNGLTVNLDLADDCFCTTLAAAHFAGRVVGRLEAERSTGYATALRLITDDLVTEIESVIRELALTLDLNRPACIERLNNAIQRAAALRDGEVDECKKERLAMATELEQAWGELAADATERLPYETACADLGIHPQEGYDLLEELAVARRIKSPNLP